jgi:thioester reductase-like protein
LQSFLERRGCWKEAYSGRVLALEGDLCLPQLGLTEETWHALSASVRWVVHAGALVNATMPYTKHRPANVLSTRELLAFCVEGESKHLDFISSMSVYSSPADSSSEKTVISPAALPISGYGYALAPSISFCSLCRKFCDVTLVTSLSLFSL